MSPEQIAAIIVSVLAIGAGGVGAVQVTDTTSQTAPPSWADDADGTINISVDGQVSPGENVTLTATYGGEPVPHAPVTVNGEMAGTTDAFGHLALQIPDSDSFEIEIEPDFEGERTIPLQSSVEEIDDTETEEESEEYAIDLTTAGNVTANESVTVTATVSETPLYGAEINVNGDFVGTTAADGTIEVAVPADADELELEAEYEESGEYEIDFDDREEADDVVSTDPIQFRVDGTIAPGETVTVTALVNETPVENASVSVNEEWIGQTDANGEIVVPLPDDVEEIEIEIENDRQSAELEYEFEESEQAAESDDDDADDVDDDEDDADDDADDDNDDEDENDDA